MEESYSESKPSSIPFLLVKVLFSPFSSSSSCEGNSIGVQSVQKLFIGLLFYFFSRFSLVEIFKLWKHESKSQDSEHSCRQQRCVDENNDEKNSVSVTTKEVEMIMERLGLFCGKESESLKETMSSEELSELFDEKEPSLEEVKDAFDVFDKNRDGFIDAEELLSVMLMLGLKEGSSLERCKQMIRKFDDNCDARIDFNEFVRFMETSFC